MLLEVQQILDGLGEAGIYPSTYHPELTHPGKAESVRIVLSKQTSRVRYIEVLNPKETNAYWTQRNGFHNSFPVTKVRGPLSSGFSPEIFETFSRERDVAKRAKSLNSWINEWPPSNFSSPFSQGLIEKLRERRLVLSSLVETQASAFLDLLDLIIEQGSDLGSEWLETVVAELRSAAADSPAGNGPAAQKLLAELCFGDPTKQTPLIWDLEPFDPLDGTFASSPSHFELINEHLLWGSLGDGATGSGLCSLTNEKGPVERDKFPQVTFSGIGNTSLFARDRDTVSRFRYGHAGPASFPVNRDYARRLAGALTYLSSEEQRGVTWALIPSEQPKKNDLLLAFQPALADLPFADAVGTAQRAVGEEPFLEFTQRLVALTAARASGQLRGRISLVVLRAVDLGNTKVTMSRRVSPSELSKAAKRWCEACRDYEGKSLFVISSERKSYLAKPPVLSPGEIPSLTRRIFRADGTASGESAGGLTFSDAFDLLMGHADPRRVRRFLRVSLRRLGSLLGHVAGVSNGRQKALRDLKSELRWTALKAQSLFALLLSSLTKSNPRIIMQSNAYRLGQLLAAVDVIHAAYCHIERRGSLPPRLLGNVAFQSAARNPNAALSQLCQRIAPHQAWLKRFVGESKDKALNALGEESDARKTVLYALKLRGTQAELAELIEAHDEFLSQKVDDAFRAHLLLGYLAGPRSVTGSSAATEEICDK